MRTLAATLIFAALTFGLIWFLRGGPGNAAVTPPDVPIEKREVRGTTPGEAAKTPSRSVVEGKDPSGALVRRLLFEPGEEIKAAHALRRGCAVGIFEFEHVANSVVLFLSEDVAEQEPQLSNSRQVLGVLLSGSPGVLVTSDQVPKYLTRTTKHRHHRELQLALGVLRDELVTREWAKLLENWSDLSAKEFERQLRELFASAPRAAALLTGLIMEDGMLKRAASHIRVLVRVLLEKGDPELMAPHVLRAFGNVQARAGGGSLHNFAMLWAQKLSMGMSALGAQSQQSWLSNILLESRGQPGDIGVDMLVALVAAAAPNSSEALPALTEILSRTKDSSMKDMVLTNVGRVADAKTVVSIGSDQGVYMMNSPRSEFDVRMQATLATALINTLGRRPQDQDVVAKELGHILHNWSADKRCHNNLVFVLDNLGHHPIPDWLPSLRNLAASKPERVAKAASKIMAAWGRAK